MSLTSILKEMESNKENAAMDLQLGSPATYGGRLGLKRAATEAIKRLRLQYRDELIKSASFIIVTGSEKDSFSQSASGDTFGCFSVDPESFYMDIAKDVSPPSVKPPLWGREGIRQLFGIAQNVFRDKATDLDIDSYPSLAFNDKYNIAVSSAEDFAAVLKTAINDQVGSEIVGIYAVNSILDKAIERKHSSPVTAVVLNTGDEKFALDLQKNLKRLVPRVFLVSAGKSSKTVSGSEGAILVKKVNDENVGEALSTIRNKIL